jgi:hypothetical protein
MVKVKDKVSAAERSEAALTFAKIQWVFQF